MEKSDMSNGANKNFFFDMSTDTCTASHIKKQKTKFQFTLS